MTTLTETTVSSPDACRLVGCTYRNLDHWCRNGALGERLCLPGGGGSRRRWSSSDLEALYAVKQVMALAGGLDLAATAARLVLDPLADRVNPTGDWLILQPGHAVRTANLRDWAELIDLARVIRLRSFTV